MKKVYFSTDVKYTTSNGNIYNFQADRVYPLEDAVANDILNMTLNINGDVLGKVAFEVID